MSHMPHVCSWKDRDVGKFYVGKSFATSRSFQLQVTRDIICRICDRQVMFDEVLASLI